jgi:hypothetical protein
MVRLRENFPAGGGGGVGQTPIVGFPAPGDDDQKNVPEANY